MKSLTTRALEDLELTPLEFVSQLHSLLLRILLQLVANVGVRKSKALDYFSSGDFLSFKQTPSSTFLEPRRPPFCFEGLPGELCSTLQL